MKQKANNKNNNHIIGGNEHANYLFLTKETTAIFISPSTYFCVLSFQLKHKPKSGISGKSKNNGLCLKITLRLLLSLPLQKN